jgi:hypothetical protein
MAIPPPATPATKDDKTNIPLKVLPGGLTEGIMPNLTIREKQTRENV